MIQTLFKNQPFPVGPLLEPASGEYKKREGDHTSTQASTGRVQTETNQTEPKKTCKIRNRRERKGTVGHAGVHSVTQRHRVLPSALWVLTQRPQPPERAHGPDRKRSRELPLGGGQPRSFGYGPGKPSSIHEHVVFPTMILPGAEFLKR